MAAEKASRFPDFKAEEAKCRAFLEGFIAGNGPYRGRAKYMEILQDVANRATRVVEVELEDVLAFGNDAEFVANIRGNTRRYVALFSNAVDALLPRPTAQVGEADVIDTLTEQRIRVLATQSSEEEARKRLPPELLRRYELYIVPSPLEKPTRMRDIRAQHVGSLVTLTGMVTRVSDVVPMMQVATYTCDICGYEVYQTVDARSYMPLTECQSERCKQNQLKGTISPQTRGSKFSKFQDARLQELASEVPVGSIPRTLNLSIRGERTRLALPGDVVTVSGIFMVTRFTGYRAIKAGLTADTYLEVTSVRVHKKAQAPGAAAAAAAAVSAELEEKIEAASMEEDAFGRLARSIAPDIFGHEDVKKALLLLLVGGVTRRLPDLKIRGEINVLLLGDPGVAKSQLLKHVASVAPRGIYTTGKGSSGVGLTAAVLRDPVTSEMTLEGGALVLADMGVCCIDEFDKMEEADRTAIHEVMEQQTVSIAKAGITTTLNARASVLAAANPIYGRYNLRRTPEENIGLPTALLSRFDLTFILRDVPDRDNDASLARHVCSLHRDDEKPAARDSAPYSADFLRAYVARARQLEPRVPPSLSDYFVNTYVTMRNDSAHKDDAARQRFVTSRSLLSVLRLSQAVARLRLADEVEERDVVEAVRLVYMSRAQLLDEEGGAEARRPQADPASAVYQALKSLATGGRVVRRADALRALAAKGLSEADLNSALSRYEALDLLTVAERGQRIILT